MTAPAIFVCGFGRCGSSLLMQMLNAGGMECGGMYPMFEDPRATRALPADASWLAEYSNKALKVLDPLTYLPDELPLEARAIWLDRDMKQQAKSYVKFQKKLLAKKYNLQIPPNAAAVQRKYLRRRRRPSLERVRAVCGEPLVLRFEHILSNPVVAVHKIREFVTWHVLRPAPMVAQVVKRNPGCLDYLMETDLFAIGPRNVEVAK